jgi:thiol-disulfide isomerase/thioredoxin
LVDSAMLNEKSEGHFAGKEKLPEGIYFFVSPGKVILFEVLMDKEQQFSVKADTAHLENISITNSDENTLFADYTKYLTVTGPQISKQEQAYKQAKTQEDSAKIQEDIKRLNDQLNAYRENLMTTHPQSMLATFFRTVKLPNAPKMPVRADGSLDSAYPFYYMKEHFWDNVAFNDDRLLRTPFFDPKLDDYFKHYVSAEPDSIIKEINYMLLYARTGKDMYKYLLGKFTDKYINPEIMGQDKVFLFLFENFFSKGDTTWLNAKQKKYIFDRAYSLMANQINEQAALLDLIDTAGNSVSLYGIQSPFIFVVFWDPECSHCKVEVPRIDSIYEAKWKAEKVKIFAVNTNENAVDDWKKFIAEKHLEGWYHVYQKREERLAQEKAGQPNFRQLYDIYQTPTFYLLDADKHILAKKLSIEQFDSIISVKIKSQASTNQ